MSDIERVWTAEEILGEMPGWSKRHERDDPGHDAMLEEAAAYWAKCTRLMAAFEEWSDEFPEALARLMADDAGLVYDLRAAIEGEDK